MEVNTDDIVIKSNVEEEMLAGIKETLNGLRAINLKLNLKKCSFSVEEGILSGHLITNCTSGKMVEWTTEADEAFRRMKELLEALPTVTAPIKGETLIIYLAASEESISAVLMAERGKKQVPVYFETPKIFLSLPHSGEHEIEFRGRNSVKGQILADFLAETPSKEKEGAKDEEAKRKEPELEKAWKLFTDGASSSDRSRAGLILVSLEGKEYTYALRFEFETTNNEAEYEALLAGLRITNEMKVQELTIFLDSQLVANQVNRLFEARQTIIKQYLEKAKKLLVNFPCHSIEHIKRDQNKKADALSKLASMTFSKLAKEVLVEWGKLPDDLQKARKLRIKDPLYRIIDRMLYRRSYLSPWLRYVRETQAKSIIQEVHQGSCEMHVGPLSVVSKIITMGYYWPSMHKDAKVLIQICETCQIYSPIPRKPKQEMISIIEATNINNGEACGEIRMGTHSMQNTSIPHISLSPPSKQAGRSNKQRNSQRNGAQSSNEEAPFSLVYGSKAVIPIEIIIETRMIQDFDPKQNEKRRREDLDILEERREITSIKEAHYKQKLEGYYNKCVRPSTFKPGTYVLRLNSASKAEFQGKMPYIVKKAYGYGAYKLETLSGSPIYRTWNGSNLPKFYI
ncbi:reverse transcriptase domain-containing protein [Tanacetum coccineum]